MLWSQKLITTLIRNQRTATNTVLTFIWLKCDSHFAIVITYYKINFHNLFCSERNQTINFTSPTYLPALLPVHIKIRTAIHRRKGTQTIDKLNMVFPTENQTIKICFAAEIERGRRRRCNVYGERLVAKQALKRMEKFKIGGWVIEIIRYAAGCWWVKKEEPL